MRDRSQADFASSPLFVLAAAISVGILVGHYFARHYTTILIVSIAVTIGSELLSIARISKRESRIAPIFLVAAFLCTGILFSLIENRPISASRIARVYADEPVSSSEPVELTGVVQG